MALHKVPFITILREPFRMERMDGRRMVKQALPLQPPAIRLDQTATAPLYKQLYERLRAQILAGQLEPRARLPSTRALAGALGVSRNTTALAYELLLLEGYVESRV